MERGVKNIEGFFALNIVYSDFRVWNCFVWLGAVCVCTRHYLCCLPLTAYKCRRNNTWRCSYLMWGNQPDGPLLADRPHVAVCILHLCGEAAHWELEGNRLSWTCQRHSFAFYTIGWGFPGSSAAKESTCNAEDPGLIPGSGRSAEKAIIGYPLQYSWASLVAQLPAMWETWVRSLSWENPLEKGTATYCSILAGEFHELYSPWDRKESDTTELLSHDRVNLGKE